LRNNQDISTGALNLSKTNRIIQTTATLRQTLEWFTWEGSMATVFIVLTGGAFLTGLALSLGASDFEIGLLGAIPFLAQALQLIGAYIIDLTGRKKLIAIRSLFIARQIWWLLLPLPLVKGEWRLTVLIAVLGLSSMAATMGAAGWVSWIADLIPERVRGRYLGFRNAAVAGATIAATLTGGAILDHFEKSELGP
jgi:MFS family permease